MLETPALQPAPERLINRRELRQRIPASDMTVWRWIKAGIFPAPLKINGRNYWRLGEVLEVINGTSPRPGDYRR
jgi:predicted DNA-binding transcriptional regulator AlpA